MLDEESTSESQSHGSFWLKAVIRMNATRNNISKTKQLHYLFIYSFNLNDNQLPKRVANHHYSLHLAHHGRHHHSQSPKRRRRSVSKGGLRQSNRSKTLHYMNHPQYLTMRGQKECFPNSLSLQKWRGFWLYWSLQHLLNPGQDFDLVTA